MIYLTVTAIAAIVVIGVSAAGLFVFLSREHDKERAQWTQTERELLNRIQRPDLVPVSSPPRAPSKEEVERRQRRARDLASVGTVTHAKRDEPGR